VQGLVVESALAGHDHLGGGDLIGTRIYAWGGDDGFRWCVAVTTLMYVLVLGVIRCVPEHVTATADGEVWVPDSPKAGAAEAP
jgi:hypothetical protein